MVKLYLLVFLTVLISVIVYGKGESTTRPNIVMIVADDLGWDDVSFHGSEETLTPNIDLLAYTGVPLSRYYTHCVCTPSRAALLTGKFAHRTGMQGYPLTNGEDRGLPLSEKILPEYLKELGYSTHLVGKWHLGQSRTPYLPTSRGFDSHFGHRGAGIDYYEYNYEENWTLGVVAGLDLYRNLTPAWDVEGYITDVYTNEAKNIINSHDKSKPLFLMLSHLAPHGGNDGAILQAPPETVRRMRHIENPERRTYAAMIKKLDDSVGEIVKTLSENNALSNTIIVFTTDNGGMPTGLSVNYASNWPLRGSKFTAFEGGLRGTALLWTPTLTAETKYPWEGKMHIVDWLPTLLRAVGGEPPTNIDGLDLWNKITANQASNRDEVFEIYDYGDTSFSSIISGDFKLIMGNVTKGYSEYLGGDRRGVADSKPSYVEAIKNSEVYSALDQIRKPFDMGEIVLRNNMRVECDHNKTILCYPFDENFCLFNIKEDPCESEDLSQSHPEVAERLVRRLREEKTRAMERPYPLYRDPRAWPRLHNYTWTTWANDI